MGKAEPITPGLPSCAWTLGVQAPAPRHSSREGSMPLPTLSRELQPAPDPALGGEDRFQSLPSLLCRAGHGSSCPILSFLLPSAPTLIPGSLGTEPFSLVVEGPVGSMV